MARILIGNIKGPKGDTGARGATGPQGATGPTGPMPPLTNNALATTPGVSALDAVMGKTLDDKIGKVNSDLAMVGNVNGMEFGTDGEKRYFVFKHNDGSKSSLEFYNNGINLVRYDPQTAKWEIIWSIPVPVK